MKTIKNYNLTVKESESEFKKVKITSSKEAYKVIKQFYHEDIEIYESFFILLLNRANETIGYAKISQGGVTGTVVDTKIIAKYCIDTLASSVILAHNHPSGNLYPSNADIKITTKIKKALGFIDTAVLDHLILSKKGYYSFADEGEI